MIVWSRPYSLSKGRHTLKSVGLILMVVVISTTTFLLTPPVSAAPQTISFSARLKTNAGNVVPDGNYNIGFKLYTQESGGQAVWSETYIDQNGPSEGSDNRIKVVNGYLSAKLGSLQAFGSQVNWEDSLWLTMNIGGTEQVAEPGWDGEMSPRIQMGAVPYAMNADTVGGKSARQLVQLGQGAQTDSSTGTSSIFINKTGEGNLLELQSAGINSFTLDQTGSITMGSAADQSITVANSEVGDGKNLTIAAGGSSDPVSGNGGNLTLEGGSASGDGNGGDVAIDSGAGSGEGEGGSISIGTVNATNISIGNADSTTKIAGGLQSDNLDASDESAALNIGQTNATSINLGQDTTIADGKKLTVGGDTTIRSNGGDSSTALQVQNSDGDSHLTVDTTNSRIKIGSNDTITSLLVLDVRTVAGDPGGTNGAMYYSADSDSFRCYQNGEWVDCITPLPVSKSVVNETTVYEQADDVKGLEFDLAANTKYYYKFLIISDTNSTNTGLGFGITAPDDPVSSHWCVNTTATLESTAGSQPGWGSYCGSGDVYTTTVGADSPGNMYSSSMEGYLETGANSGKLKLRAQSENTDATNIREGSFGILQIVK